MTENKSSISQADSDEAIGEFWGSHDFTEFDDPERPDVEFEIHGTVRLEASLLISLEKQPHNRRK